MSNFCPGCGSKLEREFKFCPFCGYQLKAEEEKEPKPSTLPQVEATNIIICDNCGEENSEQNAVCESCGVKLEGSKGISTTTARRDQPKIKETKKQTSNKVNLQHQNKSGKQINDSPKSLGANNFLLATAGVVIILLVILILTGAFQTEPAAVTLSNNFSTQSQGVDLTSLNLINELQKKVDADSTDLASLLELAHLQNDSRMFEKAISNYKKYLTVKPDDADARVDMGVCYYNLQDYENAISEMTKALSYKPDHQIAHLNLGIVNLSAGNLAKSKEWLTKAFNLNPNNEVGKRAQELLKSH
ncbi:MAG: tetratricopeptide repeat protein [Ignavibacteriales bacterium]|nr:MAG: tetratricopeptide repeat protein [Ignavibacteriales bacterium]